MSENLWALREQKRMSVAALANRTGLPVSLIMEYESGQRSIDPRHLSRLARALYVEEADIKLQSDPRPSPTPSEQPPGPEGQPTPKTRGKAARAKAAPKPPAPPRPSQLAHLEILLQKLGRSTAELEAELGKPLAELDRSAVSHLLGQLQAELAKRSAATARRRPYLPESVDEFEARYLTAAQEAGDLLHFTLFDGSRLAGRVIGFGPYTITLRAEDGSEVTINKLAIVTYRKAAPATKENSS